MTPHEEIALAFARALACGEWDLSRALLAPSLRCELSPGDLRAEFERMIAYAHDRRVLEVEIVRVEDAPADWVYVGITGADWCEAVTVTVSDADGKLFVSTVEWGRP